MISSIFGHISTSQTLFSHRKLIYKNKKKDTLGLLNYRQIKKMIYKATEPSYYFFNSYKTKKKDGNWIICGSAYNRTYILFSFDREFVPLGRCIATEIFRNVKTTPVHAFSSNLKMLSPEDRSKLSLCFPLFKIIDQTLRVKNRGKFVLYQKNS